MPATFRSSASNSHMSFQSSLTINKPAGVVAGDLLIATIELYFSVDATPELAGWTLLRSTVNGDGRLTTLYKIAGGSEPASYTFTFTGAGQGHPGGHIAAFYDAVLDSSAEASAAMGSTSIAAPSLTLSRAGILYAAFGTQTGSGQGPIHSTPTGMTTLGQVPVTPQYYSVKANYEARSAGATGTRTSTITTSGGTFDLRPTAHSVSILDANTAPTAPTVTAPNGGETIDASTTITWTAATDAEQASSALQYHVQHNANGGAWTDIVALTAAGATSQAWNTSALPAGTSYRVRVRAFDGALYGPYDESNATFTISHNQAPTAPTLLSPVGGATLDRTAANILDWAFNDPNAGDTQSKYDIRWRLVGAGTWTETLAVITTATERNVAGGTFAAGNHEWQVRTYDALGVASPWSASAFFTAATPPTGLAITSPTNGQTLGQNRHVVTWTTPAQQSFQVRTVADNAGVPNTATVYTDTGEVVSTTARDREVAFATNNRFEHVQVRIKDAGLWSSWVSVRVQVAYTPPPVPQLEVTADLYLTVDITNPAPTGTEPVVTGNDIYRRPTGSTDDAGVRVAAGVAPSGEWVDTHVGHRQDVQYRVVAAGDNNTTTTSGWEPPPDMSPLPAGDLDGGSSGSVYTTTIDGGAA